MLIYRQIKSKESYLYLITVVIISTLGLSLLFHNHYSLLLLKITFLSKLKRKWLFDDIKEKVKLMSTKQRYISLSLVYFISLLYYFLNEG